MPHHWVPGPGAVILASIVTVLAAGSAAAGQNAAGAAGQDVTGGRSLYIASCARCHGVDGAGGEGPPLARSVLPRAPDDEALIDIIMNGIPGTGMSEVWWLGPAELQRVARYVRSLAPSATDEPGRLAGDPVRGRAVYERAGCALCHTVRGFGTAHGPDLTTVGARRGTRHLREAVLDPAAALPRGLTAISPEFTDYLLIRVVDANGRELRGLRMNEDTYTLQLKDDEGTVHSFYKPDLRALEREFDRSLMQSFRGVLSDAEVDDLVAYLATLTARQRGIS